MNILPYSTKKVKDNGQKNGFLLINKPSSFAEATEDKSGPTSHDIINELRRITSIRQIGHAGTLDPFASGLLLVGIGEATKLLRHYVGLDKTYEAVLKLGAVSDTYDRTGRITNSELRVSSSSKSKIESVLKSFVGKQTQVPPMYSAKKIGGKKLYELARKGVEIERKPIEIEIYDIKLKTPGFSDSRIPDTLTITCKVSSGTYIRTLAHDIGQKLGCGAYLEELKRTRIGEFRLEDAVTVIARERIRDRSNPNDATDADNQNDDTHRDGKHAPSMPEGIASCRSTCPRNDTITLGNWQKYLTPLKTVLVSGTFDGVHEGHKNYFQQARKLGHRLIAIVGRDIMVEKIKNRSPRLSEKERIKQVKACEEIDRVYLGIDGADNEVYDFVASLKMDVIALGYDQKVYTENLGDEMKKRGLDVEVARMKAYMPEEYKSSKIKTVRPSQND